MANKFDSGIVETTFPTGALVPKAETGVLNFLQKYPEFDGRDVTIAIFDSGVDPRAIGLEKICDGKTVKVIERFDCTGCGDVDVSTKVTADENGCIKGVTGRQLKLTKQMIDSNKAKNGEFRVGMKTLHDQCPAKVSDNISNAAKTEYWDEPHKIAIAETNRKIVNFETQNSDNSKLSWDKKLIKDNLDSTIDMLNYYEKVYNDVKIFYDCILYPTEDGWQTVIDITEEGDLENAVHIGEYTKTYETKNVNEYLSVSVNVHDGGNVLEIVGMCSPHGTHVASIASGNHLTKEDDGVAPNAKIVSITIGDGRLGSMETGTALVRGIMKVMELCRSGRTVDVINMSYGEHANWSHSGRIGELMNEVVNKYGVVWVASAGNHGPALSTVGTPPDISQPSIIGVGAYVSPGMMEAEYAMREKLPGNVYTWTSRDPCIDGGQGITVCAPGGAITSVPQFTMCKSQLMNGTSMAAPHVAGAIALLISGLKQRNIQYSPYSIKRAISVTANHLNYVDPFAQGHGLLNIEKAFEHMVQHQDVTDNMLRFSVRVGFNQAKGIHMRSMVLNKCYDFSATVEPVFFNDKEVEPKEKFNFNIRLNLISSQPFVKCGAFLDMSYSQRSLIIRVDPTNLLPGVHSAVIRAYDTDCIAKGPLFEIPVTVVQPHVLKRDIMPVFKPVSSKPNGSIEFEPNTIKREFILVPEKATWAVLHLRTTEMNRDKEMAKFFIHTNQLLPKSSCRKLESMKIISVDSEFETVTTFKVKGGFILELCIAKYWSNYGQSNLNYSVDFRGVEVSNREAYTMYAGRGIHTLEVNSLISEDIQPQLQFKQAVVVLKPNESKISPLSATRDVIPDGRQIYQNILTYTLNVTKPSEVSLYAPLFNDLLYESEFESQLWMMFDSNKGLIASGDAHSHTFFTKLDKGEHTVRLQIRHEKREALEKISEATMLAHFKLANFINMDFYDSYNQCVISGGRKFTSCVVREQVRKVLYTAPITQERINKANLPPHSAWLAGLLSLPKDDPGRRCSLVDMTYILTPAEKKSNNGNGMSNSSASSGSSKNGENATKPKVESSPIANQASGDGVNVQSETTTATTPSTPKKGKSSTDDYAENLRDFQCANITKCDLEKADKIYNEVIAAHPKHVAAHLLLAQNIESTEVKSPQFPLSFKIAHTNKNKTDGDNTDEKTEDDKTKDDKTKDDKTKDDKTKDDKTKEDKQKLYDALERIIKLADLVIKETNKEELLSYYGLKTDTRTDAAKIKMSMDKQKNSLLEAFAKKGIAIAKLSILDNNTSERLEELNNIYTEIMKFSDATDSKVVMFSLWHAYALNHYGRMHKLIYRYMEDKRTRENLEELARIVVAMGFEHIKLVADRITIAAYPANFRLF